MLIEFRSDVPQEVRLLLCGRMIGTVVEIDGERYRVDDFDLKSREFRVRRVLSGNQVVPNTATENVFFQNIKHLVVG
ncbi:hypothetical protein HH212_15105 [Massilia forsythiae]|uniref:Uncharacterized protein n=1 Tax=Massilia forsythiae TaxID=2728020 RepID=A0A7Z2ZT45_9BURK|nr:hypothetical protein [Massilia forsythiae]QJE01198.1 hypothetical protein HH212_15105 [Massilia forsythiae]